jgi:hypothetical protein
MLKISLFQKFVLSPPGPRVEILLLVEILLGGVPNTNKQSAIMLCFIQDTRHVRPSKG